MDDDNMKIPYNALMKPGFTRFNLAYFIDDAEVDFILEAVKFVSTDGWRLLPLVGKVDLRCARSSLSAF